MSLWGAHFLDDDEAFTVTIPGGVQLPDPARERILVAQAIDSLRRDATTTNEAVTRLGGDTHAIDWHDVPVIYTLDYDSRHARVLGILTFTPDS